ncbi:MAG: 3-oxoacyl-[acyl-carrier-protein] reductase [Planctomycetes bacterium]|nr:3-oxoacyl-[acyl-carrier-protein] reductase [Planctomycetota bacterium]
MSQSLPLSGKTALVTGASRGIGRAVAVALAAAGASVYCTSTKAGGCDETVAAIGALPAGSGKGRALVVDVADAASVEAMAKHLLAEAGTLELLVNNAGITRDGLFLRMGADDFDAVIGTNLRGVFLVCKAFSRTLAKAKGARIVNIGSVVGITGNAGQVNYAASKAGLIGLTKSLAQEFAGRGLTANVVAPGFIATDMTAALPQEIRDGMLKNIPLSRFGAPDDIAKTVVFLCGDGASYITGQTLVVDGGMTM